VVFATLNLGTLIRLKPFLRKIIKIIGIAGVLLILYGYYLLWVPPETGFDEVIRRAMGGIMLTFIGAIMVLFYIFKR